MPSSWFLAAGTGRSEILGDRVLCVQAVQQGGWNPELGGRRVLFPVRVCVCVCVSERQRETERQRQRYGKRGDPISPPWASARQAALVFSTGGPSPGQAVGEGGTHPLGR